MAYGRGQNICDCDSSVKIGFVLGKIQMNKQL